MELPDEVVEMIERAAEGVGLSVSAWVAQTLEREITREAVIAEITAYVATLDIPDEVWEQAEEIHMRLLKRRRLAERRAS